MQSKQKMCVATVAAAATVVVVQQKICEFLRSLIRSPHLTITFARLCISLFIVAQNEPRYHSTLQFYHIPQAIHA